MTIKILLADDHQLLREGLRALLGSEGNFQVVGEASNGRAAVDLARELQPDVVVMDIRMPDLNGVDATRLVVRDCPEVKVIALSADRNDQAMAEMISAGAFGFVVKDVAFEQLVAAIQTVMTGMAYIAGHALPYHEAQEQYQLEESGPLSTREREVLQLIAEGRSTKEVARELHLSVKTVETHRRNMMEKLNVDSVAQLTRYAVRQGLTAL